MAIKFVKGNRYTFEARYWNANGCGVAIVASVTHEFDWAAYVGGVPGPHSEKYAVNWVSNYGAKLAEKDAQYFFPEFKDLPYRH